MCKNKSFEDDCGRTSEFPFVQMSQKDDSENDVWDYKPLKKKKRLSSPARSIARKTTGKAKAFTVRPPDPEIETADKRKFAAVDLAGQPHDTDAQVDSSKSSTKANGDKDAQDSSGDFCPMCQMPFCILVVQTQRWHIAECLDTPRDKCEGKDIYTIFEDSPDLEIEPISPESSKTTIGHLSQCH